MGANYTENCASWWSLDLFLCICVLDPLGWAASGVMAQKIMSIWQFNRQRASGVAGWHVGTRHGTLPSSCLITVHTFPCWVESELFWFDCTHCYLISGWVLVLCTFNDCCLIIIPHQGTPGVEVCRDVASAMCRKWHTALGMRCDSCNMSSGKSWNRDDVNCERHQICKTVFAGIPQA